MNKTFLYHFASRIFIICVVLLLNSFAFASSTTPHFISPDEETGSVYLLEDITSIEFDSFINEDKTESERFNLLPTICFNCITLFDNFDTSTKISKNFDFQIRQVFLPGNDTDLPPPPAMI